MTMLSRVADRLYWTARYIERVEDTVRLISAYHHLIMDIPKGSEPGWDVLIRILDAEPLFYERYRAANEQNVLRFLLAEPDVPCGLLFAVGAARENVRTTRDVLPEEAWEFINELHIYCKDNAENSVGRRNRHHFLHEVLGRCQRLNGLLLTTLSRDHAARFLKLGQLLERSDMTTRIIDVGAGDILDREGAFAAIDPIMWGSLLQAVSAQVAYRREIGPTVERTPAIEFVFRARNHPRSLAFCLRGVRQEVATLRNNRETLKLVDRARRRLSRFDPENMTRAQIHTFIDKFQELLNDISNSISSTWFSAE